MVFFDIAAALVKLQKIIHIKYISLTSIRSYTKALKTKVSAHIAQCNADIFTSLNVSISKKRKEEQKINCQKRPSPCASLGASLTVEASIVLPLFLFAIIQLLTAVDIIRASSIVESALHQTAGEMAVYGYAYARISDGVDGLEEMLVSAALSTSYVKQQAHLQIGNSLDKSSVSGGREGLSFLQSKIMVQDMVDLVVTYQVEPTLSLMGFSKFSMAERCRMRAWTGYDNEKNQLLENDTDDEMVYITEHGAVYHRNSHCTHIDLSVEASVIGVVESLRNDYGEKYSPCEKCWRAGEFGGVYITSQGNRYHKSINCSGLKRTIIAIKLSETGGRPPCSKCG